MDDRDRANGEGEQGAALLGVLLLLMLLSGLGAALAVSAVTETLMARNHQVAAQARAAADAGLAHAVELTLARLRAWLADGHATPGAAVTALLRGPDGAAGNAAADADNGSLEALGIVRSPGRVVLGGASDAAYELRLLDDDDPALGRGLSATDLARIGEDGQASSDANTAVVLRAIGYAGTAALPDAAGTAGGNAFAAGAVAASGAIAVAEAALALQQLPAVVTNGPLTLADLALVGGTFGGVHANGDLRLDGSPVVTRDATASGNVAGLAGAAVVGGTVAGSRPSMPLPAVRAAAFRTRADIVLTAGGILRTAGGAVLCDASAAPNACADAGHGWVYGADGWSVPGAMAPPEGTYYVETAVVISGSPGTTALPAKLTVIAEGNISITGPAVMEAATPGLLLVTDGDLLVTDGRLGAGSEGQLLVREQARVAGTAIVAGQLLVGNDGTTSTLVVANAIAGSAALTFSGAGGASAFMVTAWRRVNTR